MKDGFIKVACATPNLKVADVTYNVSEIKKLIDEADKSHIKTVVFPELCITGYTCGDLFYHDTLREAAYNGLSEVASYTSGRKMLVLVGLPLCVGNKNFNVCAVINNGKILAFVPKTHLPNYNEFYEKRQFYPARGKVCDIDFFGEKIPFGTDILFVAEDMPEFKLAVEICEDLWVMNPPSIRHAQAGATVIANLSASNELVGKAEYRRTLAETQSARLFCAYLYADAGADESTTDMVFSGHNIIAENGKILAESALFTNGLISTEIDCKLVSSERVKYCEDICYDENYRKIGFDIGKEDTVLTRKYPATPFVPVEVEGRSKRAELILSIQANALKKRIVHTNSSCAVVGISGGLDSALALLATVRAKELLPQDKKDKFVIYGITMPCFGTTNRTLTNAKKLISELGAQTVTISVRASVNRHLKDIDHAEGVYDVTYENAQARERTQVLMDFANSHNGIVIGTGDLSELALGWATYNGDHMSMYSVNCSVPKTLVKHLVGYEADRFGGQIKKILFDILDTPISPELLPTHGNKVVQVTEDKVGPYELHDFFLYYFMRYAFSPEKIFRLAKLTFESKYDENTIRKWLDVFLRRFFMQQFKRSCVPDGIKVGSVSLSPRADWRMPSDASVKIWQDDLNN